MQEFSICVVDAAKRVFQMRHARIRPEKARPG